MPLNKWCAPCKAAHLALRTLPDSTPASFDEEAHEGARRTTCEDAYGEALREDDAWLTAEQIGAPHAINYWVVERFAKFLSLPDGAHYKPATYSPEGAALILRELNSRGLI